MCLQRLHRRRPSRIELGLRFPRQVGLAPGEDNAHLVQAQVVLIDLDIELPDLQSKEDLQRLLDVTADFGDLFPHLVYGGLGGSKLLLGVLCCLDHQLVIHGREVSSGQGLHLLLGLDDLWLNLLQGTSHAANQLLQLGLLLCQLLDTHPRGFLLTCNADSKLELLEFLLWDALSNGESLEDLGEVLLCETEFKLPLRVEFDVYFAHHPAG
mmetsp:Transcript_57279/g.123183  ORF Transcript_57279/g.123183 Transcript_57279/m.123183 type:complete len:211 (-) Transcript_57279:1563-2195(-)